MGFQGKGKGGNLAKRAAMCVASKAILRETVGRWLVMLQQALLQGLLLQIGLQVLMEFQVFFNNPMHLRMFSGRNLSSSLQLGRPPTKLHVFQIIQCFTKVKKLFDLRDHGESAEWSVRVMQFFIGDELEPECEVEVCNIRAIAEEMVEGDEMCPILLDSGADSAVFLEKLGRMGKPAARQTLQLRDAQGGSIPVSDMKDAEIKLLERGAKSSYSKRGLQSAAMSSSPYCLTLQSDEQVFSHTTGRKVPIELQDRNVMVQGWIRVLAGAESSGLDNADALHAVGAELMDEFQRGPVGWQLDQYDLGIGRHHSNHYQDPSLARRGMSGRKFRTALLRDLGEWCVLELCELLDGIIDPSAEFFGYEGSRDVITIMTGAKKSFGDGIRVCFR